MNDRPEEERFSTCRRRLKRVFCECIPGFGPDYLSDCRDMLVTYETPRRAAFTVKVQEALEKATTWGEFRSMMPHSEYSRLLRSGSLDDEPRHGSSDHFDLHAMPDCEEGVYPASLYWKIPDGTLPKYILEKYARWTGSVLGDAAWFAVAGNDYRAVNAELRRRGYEVIDLTGISEDCNEEDDDDDEEDDGHPS